jgi:hypothetical protein
MTEVSSSNIDTSAKALQLQTVPIYWGSAVFRILLHQHSPFIHYTFIFMSDLYTEPTHHIDTYLFKIYLNIVLPSPVFSHIVPIVT